MAQLDLNDNNIANVGDINVDSISAADSQLNIDERPDIAEC